MARSGAKRAGDLNADTTGPWCSRRCASEKQPPETVLADHLTQASEVTKQDQQPRRAVPHGICQSLKMAEVGEHRADRHLERNQRSSVAEINGWQVIQYPGAESLG